MECYFRDFSDVEGTDLYCDHEAAGIVRDEVAAMPLKAVHHIGNGNYHYISLFFLERITVPFTLVLFDHHSDCQDGAFGSDLLSCGNWVKAAKENLPNLKSVVWVGDPLDREIENVKLGCPELPVYVSIDLDVLSENCIKTVWDQGEMTAERLEYLLGDLLGRCKVLGADICGYTDAGHPVVRRLDAILSAFE